LFIRSKTATRTWLDLFDTASAHSGNDGLNNLRLQLLGVFGDSVAGQFDFVARAIVGLAANTRTNNFLTVTFVENATWARTRSVVSTAPRSMLGAAKLGDFSGHDFTDHFSDVTSQEVPKDFTGFGC
jgi:hypothetical protein